MGIKEASSKDLGDLTCAQKAPGSCLKQCFLGTSENVPQFVLFSHLSSMHISLAAKSKICWTTKALLH